MKSGTMEVPVKLVDTEQFMADLVVVREEIDRLTRRATALRREMEQLRRESEAQDA